MSRKAAGKVNAVLEGVGLEPETIRECINSHSHNDEEAVQDGLIRWKEGQGTQPPTWAVLVEAMEFSRIDQDSIRGLKVELLRGMLFVQLLVGVGVLYMAP